MKITQDSMLLYAITGSNMQDDIPLITQTEQALKGGATFLQLRIKNCPHDTLVSEAIKIKKIAALYNVPFVINDDIYAAKEAGADGVHIGQNDMEYAKAREILGHDKIIGMTAHNLKEALAAQNAGASYIGVGAVFPTNTKSDTIPMSYDTLKEITSNVSIPVVAIGGINANNIHKLKGSGIDGVAIISAIFSAKDICLATSKMKQLAKEIKDTNEEKSEKQCKHGGNYE